MSQQTTNSLELSQEEQYFLELVNRARLNPLEEASLYEIDLNEDLASGTISAEAKPPLAYNPKLLEAARDHSQWMLDTDTFSHTGIDDTQPWDRTENVGYTSSPIGENLAWRGTTSEIEEITNFVEASHEGLFLSSGHRVNLMSDEFQEVGIGVLTGEFTTDEREYPNSVMTTQKFGGGLDNDHVFITGVVYEDANETGFYDLGEGLADIEIEATSLDNDFQATTTSMSAGGYQLEVPSGEYEVTFSGTPLQAPITEVVTVEDSNVKVDAVIEHDEPEPNFPPVFDENEDEEDPIDEPDLPDIPLAVNSETIFNESLYLEQNPDVANAVEDGLFDSALDHFQEFGLGENRIPTDVLQNFDPTSYLSENSDVADAVEDEIFQSALDHYLSVGFQEGREGSNIPYDEAFYLNEHSDVLNAVESGDFGSGFEHFALFGLEENRASTQELLEF
ncbi:hypothetical protein FRE64_11770 [Euhalothece natronophila Z-M001]|uniref:SCP domain-containing protein n=1 Tax=Euhalothece natronophila Z-M001 TaxID=522448 RepID=A0A5B8NMR1_9CHRO|nr:CAP domain-containing protein [Euhalothece natronophila]QDZ40572.1 hypothetical protein FRE64_11770 [Euhalothece natronophila Z-M001]